MKFSTNNLQFPLIAAALLTAGTMQAQVFATGVVDNSGNPLTAADWVMNYQGSRADGVSPIGVTRSNPANALGNININDKNIGEAANNSASVEFVSLGYAGTLILEFSTPICNGVGADLKVWETSYGTPSHSSWPERALVEARQHDCQPWTTLGLITQDAELDLGALSSAKYIRITDMTDPSFPAFSSSNQDAFDVDAVVGYAGCPDPGVADKFSPNEVVSVTPAFRKNGSLMAEGPNRRVQSKMLGLPTLVGGDATTPESNVNFFTAGMEGEIVLKFPYTIFGTAGADLNVYETSFGDNASRKCSNYPERAAFEGSVDGSTWFPLSAIATTDLVGGAANDGGANGANVLCRDGQLSIGAGNAINYIKLIDVSDKPSSYFPASADGYDLDGIVGKCYGSNSSPKLTDETSLEEEIGEGVFGISVYPNPASTFSTINVSAVNLKSEYTIRVIDITGRIVSAEVVNSAKGSFEHDLNIASLPAGIYAVTVETNGMTEIVKLVKN